VLKTELETLRERAARWETMSRRITDKQAVEVLAMLVAHLEKQIACLEAKNEPVLLPGAAHLGQPRAPVADLMTWLSCGRWRRQAGRAAAPTWRPSRAAGGVPSALRCSVTCSFPRHQ
jgi:hypothetical protein